MNVLARPGIEAPAVRAFNFADMQQQGRWMFPRLFKLYPQMDQRQIETWLRNIMTSSEHLMRVQEHSVGLAQVVRDDFKAIVKERFVWCENPEDKAHQKEACEFYTEFATWAGHLGSDTIIVEENSDVPHEMIKDKLGRLFERKQWFARV